VWEDGEKGKLDAIHWMLQHSLPWKVLMENEPLGRTIDNFR
jgi:hypothetical protein